MRRTVQWARDTVLIGIAVVLFTVASSGCTYSVLSSARWRCGPHTYVINPHNAPPGGVRAVHQAFSTLNVISGGVTWKYAGTTSDTSANRDRVNVVWVNLSHGYWAQSAPQPWKNDRLWTGGGVFIDPRYPVRFSVVEHELGHIAGLGHSTDRAQLMYPYGAEGKSGYQGGDIQGLQQLARECKR